LNVESAYLQRGNGDYSLTILILAGLCLGLILYIIFPLYSVDMWRGEIELHARLQLIAIEAIRGSDSAAESANGLMAIYHRYPKMLYDLLGVIGGAISGSTGLETQKSVLITIQLASFLALIAIVLRYFRAWFGVTAALLVVMLILTDQYFQVYAVFPRQNILSNLFGFWALLHYLNHQWFLGKAGAKTALAVGLLVGAAVLAHYAALELIIIIAALQCVWIGRSIWTTRRARDGERQGLISAFRVPLTQSVTLGMVFAIGIIGAVIAADALYFSLKVIAGDLEPVRDHYPVFDGLFHTIFRVHVDGAPQARLLDGSLYEGFFYLIRVVNPVLLATLVVGGVIVLMTGRDRREEAKRDSWIWVGLAGALLFALACQRFFSPARLMVFYLPLFFILFCAVLRRVTALLTGRNQKWFALYLGLLIAGLTMPRTLNTHAAIRSNAVLAFEMAKQNIGVSQVAQWGGPVETGQIPFKYISLSQSLCGTEIFDDYSQIYTSRIVPIPASHANREQKAIFLAMRAQTPVISVNSYGSLSLYRSEFPLKPDWFDFSDDLSKTKNIFDKTALQASLCGKAGN